MAILRQVVVGLFLFVLGGIVATAVVPRAPQAKPLLLPPGLAAMPILQTADEYTHLLAYRKFTAAKSMGSPANARLLDSTIIPLLKGKLPSDTSNQLGLTETSFEKSRLINGSEDHMIVIESITYPGQQPNPSTLYLKLDVQKENGTTYRVQHTVQVKTADYAELERPFPTQ